MNASTDATTPLAFRSRPISETVSPDFTWNSTWPWPGPG